MAKLDAGAGSEPTEVVTDQSGWKRRDVLAASGAGSLALTAGCLGGSSGSDGITLGGIIPLPGQSPFGDGMSNAMELIANQVNDDGGLLGEELSVVVKDSELDPAAARNRYRELVLEEEVDATFGTYSGEVGLGLFDEIADLETVHVAGGVSSMHMPEKINEDYDRYKYWFRALLNGAQNGQAQAQHMDDKFEEYGWTNIGLAIEDIDGWRTITDVMLDNVPSHVNIEFTEYFSPDTTDFTPILDQADNDDVDGLMAFMAQGGTVLPTQWAEREPDFALGGSDVFSADPGHFGAMEGVIEGMWSSAPGMTPTATPTAKTQEFIDAYEAEFGNVPPHTQAYTNYDATLAWVTAVEEADTTDADEVIPTLEEISFEATTGQFEFHGPDHEWAHDPLTGPDGVRYPVFQWQVHGGEGEQTILWPEDFATGTYQDPPWY